MKKYLLDITNGDLKIWKKFAKKCKQEKINLRKAIFRLIRKEVGK